MEKKKIENIVKKLLDLMLEQQFEIIYDNDIQKKISQEVLGKEITAYPGTLTKPPAYQLNNLDLYETNFDNQVWIDIPLWFDNEESDLTLSCIIYDVNEAEYKFSIEDIHIL